MVSIKYELVTAAAADTAAAVTAAAAARPGSPDVGDNDFIQRVVLHFSVVSHIFWIFSLDPRAGEAGGWLLRRELDRHVLDDGGLGPRPPPQSRARILAALRGAGLLLLLGASKIIYKLHGY